MKILVTAFGPFDGRTRNASFLALRGLKREFPRIHTRVLPVDSVLGPARMIRTLRLLRPEVVILLGEAAGSSTLRLETTARNELDFTIPDAAGRQPRGMSIQPGASATHRTTLPVEEIHATLEAAGHAVSLSDDAGRYLCNQVMFRALQEIEKTASPCLAGFIHVPLADGYPTSRVVEALGLAIRVIVRTGNAAVPSAARKAVRCGAHVRRR
jgi:pyroglutamyl-peptidase I